HGQWVVFEDEADVRAVALLDLAERIHHPAAERALEVRPLDDGDLRLRASLRRRVAERDLVDLVRACRRRGRGWRRRIAQGGSQPAALRAHLLADGEAGNSAYANGDKDVPVALPLHPFVHCRTAG